MALRVYMYPAGPAGMGLYSYRLANALAGKGLQVTLFVDRQFELDHLPAEFYKAKVLSSKNARVTSSRRRLSRVIDILIGYCYNSYKFYSCVRRDKPDVVHLQSFLFYPIEWYLLARLKRMRCKIVLTIHNVVDYRFYTRHFKWIEHFIAQYVYDSADTVIVHTETNKRQLIENFRVSYNKVLVIPHGEYSLDGICHQISSGRARSELSLRSDQTVILFFGYIRKIKGLDVLLKAFEIAADKHPEIVLLVVGSLIEGESFSAYRKIMDRMTYANRVRLVVRYIRHDEIPVVFSACDIVVLPYLQFFAQSGVLHLAQGFGKPVIVTDVGGLPEVVQDGRTGSIVPAGDVEKLAQAIAYLVKNDDVRMRMGQRAKEISMERFSWENIAEATVEEAYTGQGHGGEVGWSAPEN